MYQGDKSVYLFIDRRVFQAAFSLGTIVGNFIVKLNTSGLVEAEVDAPALFTKNKEHGLRKERW